MRVIIEHDDHEEIYEGVTDLALIVCSHTPVGDGTTLKLLPVARARSIFGQYPRELVKEVREIADDLRDRLKELSRNGGS